MSDLDSTIKAGMRSGPERLSLAIDLLWPVTKDRRAWLFDGEDIDRDSLWFRDIDWSDAFVAVTFNPSGGLQVFASVWVPSTRRRHMLEPSEPNAAHPKISTRSAMLLTFMAMAGRVDGSEWSKAARGYMPCPPSAPPT